MRKLIALALVAVAVMAVPAFASVQNVKVSGNLDQMYVNRQDFNLGVAAQQNYDQSFFMTAVRLRIDADLTDNVSTRIGLISERPWTAETDANTDVDIDLAYVTLREMLYSPLTVTIGRQVLNYGNGFIISAGRQNNSISAGSALSGVANDMSLRQSYDAVKLVLDYNPLTIDLFAAKEDANNLTGTGAKKDDVDIMGINANYKLGDSFDTVVEGYIFSRIDNSVRNAAGDKADTLYAPGLRASTNPITGLNLQGEIAMQKGTKAVANANNIQRDALGAMAIASYQLPFEQSKKYQPVISAAYTYVSGDSNPADVDSVGQASDQRWTAWDQMYEGLAGGKIYNSIFNLTNANIVELAASAKPMEDVTTKLTYTTLWLDKVVDSTRATGLGTTTFLTPDGVGFTPLLTSNKGLGSEWDADITYAYTEDVTFGLSLGVYNPGEAFDSANDKSAKQALASVGVAF